MLRRATPTLREALAQAVAHARLAPFYARTLGGPRGRPHAALPLLDKATAAEQQDQMRVGDDRAVPVALRAGVVSSATTRSGRPLRVPLELATTPSDDARGEPADGPLTLQLYSPRHGVRVAGPREVLLPATLHRNTVDVTWDLLSTSTRPTKRRSAASFEALVAPLSTLKWLTVALGERGIAPRDAGLQVVGVTGYPVTAHARAWLEAAWGCPLVDNYSLSELPGYAYPSERTGFQHAVDDRVWFELIDPLTLKPRAPRPGALGELVATTLHRPLLPLIRYRTGDIVEVGPFEASWGSHGVRFRGRVSMSLLGPGRRRHLALSRDVLEVAEACADVAMEPHPAEVLRLVPPCDVGVPRVLLDDAAGAAGPRLRAELRYDPSRYPARAAAVRALFQAVVAPAVHIELLRPGSLDVHHLVRKL